MSVLAREWGQQGCGAQAGGAARGRGRRASAGVLLSHLTGREMDTSSLQSRPEMQLSARVVFPSDTLRPDSSPAATPCLCDLDKNWTALWPRFLA